MYDHPPSNFLKLAGNAYFLGSTFLQHCSGGFGNSEKYFFGSLNKDQICTCVSKNMLSYAPSPTLQWTLSLKSEKDYLIILYLPNCTLVFNNFNTHFFNF